MLNLSRLTGILTQNSQLLTHNSFNYAYDNSSRRIRVDTLNDSIYYSYDKVSQLLQESSPGYSIAYAYDQTGNRLTQLEDGSTTAYGYNNLNQLTQSQGTLQKLISVKGTVSGTGTLTVKVNGITANVTGSSWTANNIPINSGLNTITAEVTDSFLNLATNQISVTYNPTTPAITYTYDKNGNLIQQAQGTQITQYSYDFENRLKAYTSPAQTASYAYNGQGKRISKTVNSATTKYYYDGDELIAEKTGASPIYYLHSPRIDEIISDSRGYYYHSDGLGSVVSLTDFAGTKAADYTYKAFGGMRSQTGSVSNPWLFTGRQFDQESGLYFYRNRYYEPRAGRFITRDPIGIAGGINLYGYVDNNPVNLLDPFGLEPNNRSGWQSVWNWWSNQVTFDPWRAEQIVREVSAKFPIGHNDPRDAMRHAEWSKRMAEEINQLTSWASGWAHELDNMINNNQPWMEMQMDLNNNKTGRDAAWNQTNIDQNKLTTIYPQKNNGPY